MSNENIKILSPMTDIIFKLLMGTEHSKDILKDFLIAVLDLPPDEYEEITIQNPFLMQEYKGDKLGILDVRLKLKSGKVLNCEVQVDPMPFMESRIIFYISKMITEQIGESDQYDKIKRVISIIITGHTIITQSENYHHHFRLYDKENGILLTDALEIHTLEVPKTRKLDEDTKRTELFDWMKFFDIKTKEELDMLATKSPAMRRATIRLKELSADEKARQLYEARLKEQRDSYARERGAVKTREQEIAKNALKMKMSIDDIIKLTGLTEEEITALQNADK